MKSITSYLIVIFAVIYWIFRVVITLLSTLNMGIGIEPIDTNFEIILLFITLVAMVLVIRRSIIGGIIYFVTYFMYFGLDAYNGITSLMNGTLDTNLYMSVFASFLGIILSIVVLVDVALTRGNKSTGRNKKTDWFYRNKQFDRQLDERVDKNNYKF